MVGFTLYVADVYIRTLVRSTVQYSKYFFHKIIQTGHLQTIETKTYKLTPNSLGIVRLRLRTRCLAASRRRMRGRCDGCRLCRTRNLALPVVKQREDRLAVLRIFQVRQSRPVLNAWEIQVPPTRLPRPSKQLFTFRALRQKLENCLSQGSLAGFTTAVSPSNGLSAVVEFR